MGGSLDGETLTKTRATRASRFQRRSKVFISYSHNDVVWRDRLRAHLEPLSRADAIVVWDDTHIEFGVPWEEAIAEELSCARVAVLLVSADFLASSFIQKKEIPALLTAAERDGATVIPIIVAPCMLDKFPAIARLQAANSLDRSLLSLSPAEQEKVLVDVARRIERLMSTPIERESIQPRAPWLTGLVAALFSAVVLSTHDAELKGELLVANQVVPALREVLRVGDDLNTASAHYLAHDPSSEAEFRAQVTELNGYVDAFNTASGALKAQRLNLYRVLNDAQIDSELGKAVAKALLDSANFKQDGYARANPEGAGEFLAKRNALMRHWTGERVPLQEHIKRTRNSLDRLEESLLRRASRDLPSCVHAD